MDDIVEKLDKAETIIYDDIDLYSYAKHYEIFLSGTYFRVRFENNDYIDILCLERHFPHFIGLHHFLDKKSKNKKMRYKDQLQRNAGFNNILNRKILLEDLQKSNNGKTWKRKEFKKRVLSIHLLKKLIINSDVYLCDGKIGKKLNTKYIFLSNIKKDYFNICVDEDIEYNRLGNNFCCISNLIGNKSDKYIENAKKMNVISIEHRELYSNKIIGIYNKKYKININGTNIITKAVDNRCIDELINKKCCFNASLCADNHFYHVSYFYFDAITSRIVNKYI